jgi:hypothetical protein
MPDDNRGGRPHNLPQAVLEGIFGADFAKRVQEQLRPWLAPYSPVASKAPARKRGPKSNIRQRIEAQMRKEIKSGELTPSELRNMPEKLWEARYGASRTTVREARDGVLSEFN